MDAIEVDLRRFAAAHADGATVVDVREEDEYVTGHVPGARFIPLGHLARRVSEVPADDTVYVICATGNRSKAAAGLLLRHGVAARSVAGGTSEWIRSGRPVVAGAHPR